MTRVDLRAQTLAQRRSTIHLSQKMAARRRQQADARKGGTVSPQDVSFEDCANDTLATGTAGHTIDHLDCCSVRNWTVGISGPNAGYVSFRATILGQDLATGDRSMHFGPKIDNIQIGVPDASPYTISFYLTL